MGSAVKLRRLTVESMAIVGSILLAFVVDAWWEDSKETQRSNALLGDLKEEILTNIGGLEQNIERQKLYYQYSKKMVAALLGQVELTPAEFDELQLQMGGYPVFRPSWGVLDLLTNSGDLLLLEDSTLRTKLANLKPRVGIYVDNQEIVVGILTSGVSLFETGELVLPYNLPDLIDAEDPAIESHQIEKALKIRQFPMFMWDLNLKDQAQLVLEDLQGIAALLP